MWKKQHSFPESLNAHCVCTIHCTSAWQHCTQTAHHHAVSNRLPHQPHTHSTQPHTYVSVAIRFYAPLSLSLADTQTKCICAWACKTLCSAQYIQTHVCMRIYSQYITVLSASDAVVMCRVLGGACSREHSTMTILSHGINVYASVLCLCGRGNLCAMRPFSAAHSGWNSFLAERGMEKCACVCVHMVYLRRSKED